MNGYNIGDALKGASLAVFLVALSGCPGEQPNQQADKSADSAKARRAMISDAGTNAARNASAASTNAAAKKAAAAKPRRPSPALLQSLLEAAAESGNISAIGKIAAAYRASPDPQARMECVEALFGIGSDGVISLASFVNDPDKEVSEHAYSIMETQIDIVEDNFIKMSLLDKLIMGSKNEDQLKVFCSKLEAMPPTSAVRKIVEIVEKEKLNPAAAAAAKEEFETITGRKFRSVKDAYRWARMAER